MSDARQQQWERELTDYNEKIEILREELLIHIKEMRNLLVSDGRSIFLLNEKDRHYRSRINQLENFMLFGDKVNGETSFGWANAINYICTQNQKFKGQEQDLFKLFSNYDNLKYEKKQTEKLLEDN